MKKSYYFSNFAKHINIDFDSGYACFYAPSSYAEPINFNSMYVSDLNLYDPSDMDEIPVKIIDKNRITYMKFEKYENKYFILTMYVVDEYDKDMRKTFIVDYYSYHFNKLGIKNYYFDRGYLIFDDELSRAQFEFYFGDIII